MATALKSKSTPSATVPKTMWSPIEIRDDDDLPIAYHVVPIVQAPGFRLKREAIAYGEYIESLGSPAVMGEDDSGNEVMYTYIGHTLAADCLCGCVFRASESDVPMWIHNQLQ